MISNLSHPWLHHPAFLLDNISDVVISTDLKYHIKTWNKAAEEMFGLSGKEVMDRPIQEVLQYEFRTESRDLAWQKLKETGKWKGVLLHRTNEGKEVYLEVRSSAVKDPDGSTSGFVSIYRDITVQKNLEKMLIEEEQRKKREIIQAIMEARRRNDGK